MTTRMSGTSGRWSMWMAVAFLMAMTSTLSAQFEGKGGPTGASPNTVTAATSEVADVGTTLSGQDMIKIQPPYAGWCGTTDLVHRQHILAHVQSHLVAVLFRSGLHLFPGRTAVTLAAMRIWIESKPAIKLH